MIYLIYANQQAAIANRLKSIVKTILNEKDEMNYARFDGTQDTVQTIVDECNSIPLGYEKKVVVLDSCYFLLKPKPRIKIESDQDYKVFLDYIKNPNESCNLILTIDSFSIDSNNEIVKEIVKNGTDVPIKEVDGEEWVDGVENYCKIKQKLDIDDNALYELAERTHGDIALLQNSVTILQLYKDKITLEDVELMVAKPLEDNTFQMYNYLMQGKNIKAVSLLRDLQTKNVEPVTLISMLATQFRLLNQIIYLNKRGYDDGSIASELNIKPVRVNIMKRTGFSMNQNQIINILETLYNLDWQIKSGQVDRYYAFELFLINFKRK